MAAFAVVLIGGLGVEGLFMYERCWARPNSEAMPEPVPPPALKIERVQTRLIGLDAAGVDEVRVASFSSRAGKALGVFVEDDLRQVLAEDRRVTGATGMDFGEVHDFHLAVVAQEAAFFALA